MIRRTAPPAAQPWAWGLLGLALLWLLAPWPVLQGAVHGFLVVALFPLMEGIVAAALWALAAGWSVEGALRMMPHLGGTPWADLSLVLLLRVTYHLWPPDRRSVYLGRLVAGLLLQGLLVHGAVALANGAHAWGSAWLWTAASGLVWGPLSWKLHQAYRRR